MTAATQNLSAGFTLIEAILAILLLAIAIPPLLNLFSNVTVSAAQPQILPTATFLAAEVMEEIKARKFDELDVKNANGNWSTVLGTDAGESVLDKNTFDDIDDFNNWTQGFGAAYPGYTAQVSVNYVASGNLSQALLIPGPVPNNWTPSYKNVTVTLSGGGLAAPIKLVTVMTEVQSL